MRFFSLTWGQERPVWQSCAFPIYATLTRNRWSEPIWKCSCNFSIDVTTKGYPITPPGSRPQSINVRLSKDSYLSKASLIAFSVPRWLIMLLLRATAEQVHIEAAKGFDRLDCLALGLTPLAGDPRRLCAQRALRDSYRVPPSDRERFSHCFIRHYLNLSTYGELKGARSNGKKKGDSEGGLRGRGRWKLVDA